MSGPTTVTAGGVRAHSYEVKAGDTIDEYTFVLRGKREFQLLCRRQASSSDDACKQLLTSFSVALAAARSTACGRRARPARRPANAAANTSSIVSAGMNSIAVRVSGGSSSRSDSFSRG